MANISQAVMNETTGSFCLLVTRLSDEQWSKLKHVSCYHVFLADDLVCLLRFLAMCKDDSDTATYASLRFTQQFTATYYAINLILYYLIVKINLLM